MIMESENYFPDINKRPGMKFTVSVQLGCNLPQATVGTDVITDVPGKKH